MPLPTLNLRYTPLAFSLLLATLGAAALPAHAQQQTDATIPFLSLIHI